MKKAVKRLFNVFGYRIGRLTVPDPFTMSDSFTEPDPFTAMQSLLVGIKEPIIFDVGAHHGLVSRHFRSLFPSSTVYSFEPFPDSFEELRINTASDPRIKAFNFGLSDRNGAQSFHSNPSSATNSLLATDELGSFTWGDGLLETQNVVKAEFKTIDSVLDAMNIPRIDILKLDVQGAEPLVMEGALSACRTGIIGLVYSEIIIQPTYKGQKRLDESLATFYANGFDLFSIYNMSFTAEGRLRQVDVIFTKQK
jgi:FkbM family methyltransferase